MNGAFRASIGLSLAVLLVFCLLVLWPIALETQQSQNCCDENRLAAPLQSAPKIPPPDLRQLFQQGMAASYPTEEQLAEERAVDDEQVEQAHVWLQDADPTQRVTGAEQLSAYPTPAAENYLLAALQDVNNEVRAAAANSLAAFRSPGSKTFEALVKAMQDGDQEVRFNAWSSLGTHLNRPDLPQKTAKKIQSQLAKLLKQGRLVDDIEDGVREYLQDQQNN